MDGWKLPRAASGEYDRIAGLYKADAWLVGRTTMTPYASRSRTTRKNGNLPAKTPDFIAGHSAKSFAIVIDPSGKLMFNSSDIGGEHIIVIVSGKAPAEHLARLRKKRVSYLFGGPTQINLKQVLVKLRAKFGIKKILLEGGGKINGAMLKAGLINELSILIAPTTDGKIGVPTLFDTGNATASARSLKLLSHKAIGGDIVWLRYAVSC